MHYFNVEDSFLAPNQQYSLFHVLMIGYYERGIREQYVLKSFTSYLLDYSTGCMSDTEMRVARWNQKSRLIDQGSYDEKPINISVVQSKYKAMDIYPWTDKMPDYIDRDVSVDIIKEQLLEQFVSNWLGVSNLLVCMPVDKKNLTYYRRLAQEFKNHGFQKESDDIDNKLAEFLEKN